MKNKITKENLIDIKEFIDEQLRIRCINVETKLKLVKNDFRTQFELSSTKFNTIPVIHSEIEIVSFGTNIVECTDKVLSEEEEIEEIKRIRFWIGVSASYKGNGEKLFGVFGIKNQGDSHVFLKTNRFN